MKSHTPVVLRKISFVLVVLIGLIGLSSLMPATALALHTDPGTYYEDPAIKGCSHCHGVNILGGNRNGSARLMTNPVGSPGIRDHVKEVDWSATVARMIGKGSPADPVLAPGYLNMNYCSTCTGVIMSSPATVGITDTSATITWTTSLNGSGDGPADSVVFYGTNPSALTSQASDPSMTGSHAVKLTGLKAQTKYYFQYQSTGADGKTVKYNFDTPFFRTTAPQCQPPNCGGGTTTTTFAYVTNREANSISVIDTAKKILQTTIFLNEEPAGIVASPDGKTVYVAAWYMNGFTNPSLPQVVNDLFVIDTATNTIKSTVPNITPNSNTTPIDLAISPDGQYLYGMHWTNELLAISTATLSVVKSTILPCAGCSRLAVSPDGTTIYAVSGIIYTPSYSHAFKIDAASAVNPAVSTVVTPINTINTGTVAVAIGPDNRAWIPGDISGYGFGFTMVNTNGTTKVVSPCAGYDVTITASGDTVFSSSVGCGASYYGVQQFDPILLRSTVFSPDTLQNYIYSGVGVSSDGATLFVAADCLLAGCPSLFYFVDTTTLSVNGSVQIGTSNLSVGGSNESRPHKVALAKVTTGSPAGPPPTLIYSANGAANNVSVIDPATNAITATIAVGMNPQAVAPSPDGKLVYAVNGDGTISVITRSTQTVTATITLPDPTTGYMAAIVGPGNNVLYVANHDAMKVYAINTSNNTITATIPITNGGGGGPFDLAITPDGGTLYVSVDTPSGFGNGSIIVVSTVSNSVVGTIVLPTSGSYVANQNRIAMNPLGGYLYATVDPYLVVIDTGANNVITRSMLPGTPLCYRMRLAVTPDGGTVAVSCSNTLYTFDTGTLQSTANSAQNIADALGPIAFNADGTKAYIASANSGVIDVIDMTTLGAPVATIALPAMSNLVAASPAVASITGGTPISLTAPDLTITSISATSPVNLSTYNNISITDTVANIGAYKSGSFVINYYFSPTNAFNNTTAVYIGSRPITSPFNAGATNTATSTFIFTPMAIAAGNYYVFAFADGNEQIAEGNEDNNKTPTTGTVQVIVADLVSTAVSSPAIGTTVLPGATISITDTVKNQGSASVGSFSVGYYLVPIGAGRQNFLGSRTVSSLAAGATSTGTVSLKIPTGAYGGPFYLQAIADYANAVAESNETNNSYTNMTGIITVSPPDLIMTAVSETPTTITRPGTISITFTVKNQGVSTAGPFFIGIYLSTDNVITTSDKYIGSYYVKNGLGAGVSVSQTVSAYIGTSIAAGTYYVGAYADYSNMVLETNETNNGQATAGTIVVH